MYHMVDSTGAHEKLVRVKGASRQTHPFLRPSDFEQRMDRPVYANRYRLAPTPGHDLTISFESKKLISAVNGKRRCEVSLTQPGFLCLRRASVRLFAGSGAHSPAVMAPSERRRRGERGGRGGAEKGLESVRRHLIKEVKKGVIPSVEDLAKFARSKRIEINKRELSGLKRRVRALGPYERVKNARKAFFSNLHPRYGQVMVDLAFYRGRWRRHNGGAIGFFLGVEMTSKQTTAVPINSKKKSEIEEAVRKTLETGVISRIRTLISDRESAVLSKRFRESVWERYAARVHYLGSRHKAFLAELYIRVGLSRPILAARGEGRDVGGKKRARLAPPTAGLF